MAKPQDEYLSLKTSERWLTGLAGGVALAFATYLVLSPPIRQSEVVDKLGVTQSSHTQSDQSSVVIVLFTAAAAFLFYAVNGLRLTKFTAGPISGESGGRQGTTKPLDPSPQSPATSKGVAPQKAMPTFDSLTEAQKKVLRTLWRYQNSNFHGEFSTRWTFKVSPNAPEYPEFLEAVAGLVKLGYVLVNPTNDQCALTNEGIILMSSVGEQASQGAFYIF